jgi:hypothetical protein
VLLLSWHELSHRSKHKLTEVGDARNAPHDREGTPEMCMTRRIGTQRGKGDRAGAVWEEEMAIIIKLQPRRDVCPRKHLNTPTNQEEPDCPPTLTRDRQLPTHRTGRGRLHRAGLGDVLVVHPVHIVPSGQTDVAADRPHPRENRCGN